MRKKEASVNFSGGSDSTLAAALMCEEFKKVHLLTVYHKVTPREQVEKSKINAERLVDKYGEDRVVHKFFDIEEIFKSIYYGPVLRYLGDIIKYGTFLNPFFCHSCQLAMFTNAIIYDIENGVRVAADGYKREKSHIYITMADKGVAETKKFFAEYGIEYMNPVYDIVRTDWELYDLGITNKRDVKWPHETVKFSTQAMCSGGFVINAHLMGYALPRYGKEENVKGVGIKGL